jgi:alkylation response protein AidB-like acyl-CoA dehydrogenase
MAQQFSEVEWIRSTQQRNPHLAEIAQQYGRMVEVAIMAGEYDRALNIVSMAFEELMSSSNMAFGMYPGLTQGAVSAILVKGSAEQKAKYAPNMISGKWGGTMNLTEPHCGTDLGLIRTKAEPNGDGSFAISGDNRDMSRTP